MRYLEREIWPQHFQAAAERRHGVPFRIWAVGPLPSGRARRGGSPYAVTRSTRSLFYAFAGSTCSRLPWWLEDCIRGEVHAEFQTDLMYSTVSGYCFIRMLDDVMDGHEVDRAALPALHPFHLQFVKTYHSYFPALHPFWQEFERILMTTAEAVTAEAILKDFHESDFLEVSARKPAPIIIRWLRFAFGTATLIFFPHGEVLTSLRAGTRCG